MKKLIILHLIFQAISINNWTISAQEIEPSILSALNFNTSYTGDFATNISGGIKSGSTYLGMATMSTTLDINKTNWWRGGEAFIKIANTHGGKPSSTLIGDYQGVSNIEAGNLSWLYELWYKQTIGNISVTAGLQDLNTNFASSDNGTLFSNSSFGIHSTIAYNISSPIFPLTALGVIIQWQISENYLLKAAIFDGTPDDFVTNPYNLAWKVNKNEGCLAVAEFQSNKNLFSNLSSSYKFGTYYHNTINAESVKVNNYGLYFVGDQQLSTNISVFSQIGISPKSLNQHNNYISCGLNYKGIFNKRTEDQMGLAIAYAGISGNEVGSETTIELTYQYQVSSNIYIRPDIQYVINPARTGILLENALVGFLRFGVEF